MIPESTAKLWHAIGAEDTLGELAAQPLREAGTWGRLPAGAQQHPLAVLFPRIETEGDSK